MQITAAVTDILYPSSYYSSILLKADTVDGEKANFNILLASNASQSLSKNDIISAEIILGAQTDYKLSGNYMMKNRIIFEGELTSPENLKITGKQNGIFARFDNFSSRLGYILDFRLKPKVSALAKALLLGDDNSLPKLLERNFKRIGLTHIIALSGSHLAFMTFLISILLKPILKKRRLVDIIEVGTVIFYLLLTGFPTSLMRAGIMLIICKLAYIFRRKPDSLTALFFTVIIMLIIQPYAILDYGLILSFSATFGILLLFPYLRELKNHYLRRKCFSFPVQTAISFVYDGLCLSFCACTFTNIACVLMFRSFSLIGIFSTLIFTPIISLFMLISALVLVFHKAPAICSVLSELDSAIYDIIEKLASSMATPELVEASSHRADFTLPLMFLACYFAVTAIINFSKGKFIAIALAIQMSVAPMVMASDFARSNEFVSKYIPDGQNEAFILSHGNDTLIIDISSGTSSAAWMFAQEVYKSGKTDIDILMLTHYHYRHSRYIESLNSVMPIKKLYLPTPLTDSEEEYSFDITEYAKENDIPIEFYNSLSDGIELFGHFIEVLPSSRFSPKSHPEITLRITTPKYKKAYLTSVSDKSKVSEFVFNAETVYIGNHASP